VGDAEQADLKRRSALGVKYSGGQGLMNRRDAVEVALNEPLHPIHSLQEFRQLRVEALKVSDLGFGESASILPLIHLKCRKQANEHDEQLKE
jgi:hypothetical protein